jgi:hypothetical protein
MSDIDNFVLPDTTPTAPPAGRSVRPRARPRISGYFLRGPIPWVWIREAHALGGNALATGLALRTLSGINRGQEFPANLARIATMTGVSPGTVRRAVQSLAEEGLITVIAAPGRRNVFQIVEVQPAPPGPPEVQTA